MFFCSFSLKYKYSRIRVAFLIVALVFLVFSSTVKANNSADTVETAITDFNKNDLDKALADTKNELDSISKLSNPGKLAIVYSKYAMAQQLKGNYDVAIQYAYKALELFEKLNDKRHQAYVMMRIASMQRTIKDYRAAKVSAFISLKLTQLFKDSSMLVDAYNSLGNTYDETEMLDSALFYYNNALVLNRRMKNKLAISYSLDFIAGVYVKQKRCTDAMLLLEECLALRTRLNDTFAISIALTNIGETYLADKKIKEAINSFKQAYTVAQQVKYRRLMVYLLEILSKCYAEQGNYKTAFEYTTKYQLQKDSLMNEETQKSYVELKTKYETAKKDEQIQLLSREKELQEAKLFKRKVEIAALIVLLVISCVLYYLLYQRNKQKQALAIAEGKRAQQQEMLRKTIEVQDEERKQISKELHDGVGQVLSAVKMNFSSFIPQVKALQPNIDRKYTEAILMLDEACAEVRSVAYQMMPASLKRYGLAQAIEDMLQRLLSNTSIKYHFNQSLGNQRLTESVEISLYRISQELVNNCVKHAKASSLSIDLYTANNALVLMVEDDGIGIVNTINKGGMGMSNIESRIQALDGTFHIENAPNAGVIATVRIPLSKEV